jgi:mitochondrial fission protein ELM1
MQNPTQASERSGAGKNYSLFGAKAWIISDGKAGHEALCRGVAEALGLVIEWKRVAPTGLWKTLAPWAPVAPRERFGEPGTLFAPPWPAIAFAAGRTTTPYIRALKKKAGLKTYTVVMMDPKTGAGTADLFWVPEHDKRRGPNVITTPTAPHPLSPARLAEIRSQPVAAISALKHPRVAVLVGGPNERYRYPQPVIEHLAALVRSLADLGAGLMITTSRRTPEDLIAAIETAVQGTGAIVWKGDGPNPYPQFLAHADAFLVTADSVNMAGEAAATGKPIYIFEPPGGADKFTAFHKRLRDQGVTRAAPDRFETLGTWSYEPLYAADIIADEIERRWQRRRTMLSGLT